jgi:hypothetical protein
VIDPTHAAASWFLWLAAAPFLIFFALPLFFVPLTWARWFRWELPADKAGAHLAEYLGRCVGALALVVLAAVIRAAPQPAAHAEIFDLIIGIGAIMVLVHAYGAIHRIQPWTEDAEILLYGTTAALAAWFRTTL